MNSGQFDDSPSRPQEGETRNSAVVREEQNLQFPTSTATTSDGSQSNPEEATLSLTKSIEVGSSNDNSDDDEAKAESQEEPARRVAGILAAGSNKKEKSGDDEAVAESGEAPGERASSTRAPVAWPVVSTAEERPVKRDAEERVEAKTGSVELISEQVSNEAEQPPLSANKDEVEAQDERDADEAKDKSEVSPNEQDSKPAARKAKEPPMPMDKDVPEEQEEHARRVAGILAGSYKKEMKKEILTESGEPPGKDDILFGRGVYYYNHNNKTTWRKLIMNNYQVYGGLRYGKTREFASKLVNIIKSKGHRFLQEKDGIWKDAKHEQALVKTMQALRDESRKHRIVVQPAARRSDGPKTTSGDQEDVEDPQEQDVLFGTGMPYYKHNSRTLWRQLIDQRRPIYNSARSRGEGVKRRIAEDIVESTKQVGARFLELGPDRRRWEQVPEARVIAKTMMTLRQKRKDDPDLKKEHLIVEEEPPPDPARRRAIKQQKQQGEEMERQHPPFAPPVAYPHQYRPYPMGAVHPQARMPVPPAVGHPHGQHHQMPVPPGTVHSQQMPIPPYGNYPPSSYLIGRPYPPMMWQPPQGPRGPPGVVAGGGPHAGFWPMQFRTQRDDAQQQVAQGAEQSAPVAGATVGGSASLVSEGVVSSNPNTDSYTREVEDDDAMIVEGDNANDSSEDEVRENVTNRDNRNVTGKGDTQDIVPENVTSGGNRNTAGPVPENVSSGNNPNVAGGDPESAPVTGAIVEGSASFVSEGVASSSNPHAASYSQEVEGDNGKDGSQDAVPENATNSDNQNVAGKGDTQEAVPESVTSGGNQNATGPVPEDVASGNNPNVAGGDPDVAVSNSEATGHEGSGEPREYDFLQVFF